MKPPIPEADQRWICLTARVPTVERFARAVAASARRVDCAEFRADALQPGSVRESDWLRLPDQLQVPLVFTWRSPGEGGFGGTRPPGLLPAALDAGFAWIDVEADALEAGDVEATAVPLGRRWVSRHLAFAPRGRELERAWENLRRHPGALHKLVLPGDDFEVNEAVLDLLAHESRGQGAVSVFAMGKAGAPSRILAGLAGNAVTFVAPPGEAGTAPGQPDLDRLLDLYRFRDQTPETPLFGVLGRDVESSLSPAMHNRALDRAVLPGLYLPFSSEEAAPVIAWLRSGRLRGLSVTQPFKEDAARLADRLDPVAERIGAANTLTLRGEVLEGVNTDRHAVLALLEGAVPAGGRAAVLGAGGAALAAGDALRGLGGEPVLFNRDPRRGKSAAVRCGAAWGGSLDDFEPGEFAAVVNATPMGVGSPVPKRILSMDWPPLTFLDLAYGPVPSAWERPVGGAAGRYIGGRLFLAVQGTEQFRIWTGRSVSPEVFGEGILT